MIGTDIAQYHVVEMLGEGGMGVVYKAVDVNLDRTVALKVLSPELSREPGLIQRFQSEAKAQASLNHSNIATLYNFLNVEGNWLIIMEFVDGESLEQLILRRGMMQAPEAVGLFKQALAGIGFAHRHGIIHRDIKPANIMVNGHGTVKVMDFGIAKALSGRKLTRTGVAVGTVSYMSPEQIRNHNVDNRSDIYSLGVTLYQMLTAHLPFDSESDFQVQFDHVNTPPPPLTSHYPYIPPGIEAAVLRSMEKEPANRFRTVEEFATALDHADVAAAPGAGASHIPYPQPVTARPSSPNAPSAGPYATAATPATATPPPRQATMVERPIAPTVQVTTTTTTPPPVPPSPKSNNMLIGGIAALVVAAGLGFGIWKWSSSDKSKDQAKNNSSSQTSNNPGTTQTPNNSPASRPTQQTSTTPTAPPSNVTTTPTPKPDQTLPEQTAKITPPVKGPDTSKLGVPKGTVPKGTVPPQKTETPPPVDPGTLALQKAQQLYLAQPPQLIYPVNNCALSWARQATNAGNPAGPEMEKRIQSELHSQLEDLLKQKNFPMASTLVNDTERYYPGGTFQAWKNEVQSAQQAAMVATQPKPTIPAPVPSPTSNAPTGAHTYRVAHRHVNKGNNQWIHVNTDPPEWFYNGTLTIAPDGGITFRCQAASLPQRACEADIEIASADIKGVKATDMLHIAARQGNFDFRADGNTLTAIRNDLTAAKK